MSPIRKFDVALILIPVIAGVTLAAPPVKQNHVRNVIKETQEFSFNSRGNQTPVMMVDDSNRFETLPKYRVEPKSDRNILSDSVYTTSGTIIGNKANNGVEGIGTIYVTKGNGDHSNTYITGSTRAKVEEVIRDNYGDKKSEVSNSVKGLVTDYGFKVIGGINGVEGSVVSKEKNGASYDDKGTKFGFDVLNTRANGGDSGSKAWFNIKENRANNIDDDDIEFNVRGEKTPTSVKNLGVAYETSSPSFHQNESYIEKRKKGVFLDRIFAIPINILRSVTTLLNLKHQIMQDSNANYADKSLEVTSGIESKYGKITGDVDNAEHEKTSPMVTMPEKMYGAIFNIPITILKSVRDLFKWFVQ